MNEVADSGSYARLAITFDAAAGRSVAQAGALTFATATGSWGTVTHWAIVDSATHGAGNMLAHGALNESKSVVSGNTPSIADGVINVTFSAGGIGTAVVHKLLDLAFRNVAYTQPSTYVALTTATLSDSSVAGSMSEVSGGSYARVLLNKAGGSNPTWEAVANGASQNEEAVVFPTATASWGTVVAAAVVSSASGAGDVIFYDNSIVDQLISTDDVTQFAAGAFDVAIT